MNTPPEMELAFATYQARQQQEVSLEGLSARAERLTPGGRFRLVDGVWQPQPYPGHAVLAMVDGVPGNSYLADRLGWMQREVVRHFPAPGALAPLPPASFHQTLANTLSGDRHQRLVVERGLRESYPQRVTAAMAALPVSPSILTTPVVLRIVGLGIFGTALGALGVFEHEHDFRRVLHFRDQFYGHEDIARLGIQRTRPFIGHVTIAYVERPLAPAERMRLVDLLAGLNRVIAERNILFHLPHAELRAYEHLAEFRELPGLPGYQL